VRLASEKQKKKVIGSVLVTGTKRSEERDSEAELSKSPRKGGTDNGLELKNSGQDASQRRNREYIKVRKIESKHKNKTRRYVGGVVKYIHLTRTKQERRETGNVGYQKRQTAPKMKSRGAGKKKP